MKIPPDKWPTPCSPAGGSRSRAVRVSQPEATANRVTADQVFCPLSAEHYRAVALHFRKRAADTSDLQLRQAIRCVAARYEALGKLAEAEDRLRGRDSLHCGPYRAKPASAPDTLGLRC